MILIFYQIFITNLKLKCLRIKLTKEFAIVLFFCNILFLFNLTKVT